MNAFAARVVALAGRADDPGRRGEEDERGQVKIAGRLVQMQRRVDLRAHHALELLGLERLDQPVLEHAGGTAFAVEVLAAVVEIGDARAAPRLVGLDTGDHRFGADLHAVL